MTWQARRSLTRKPLRTRSTRLRFWAGFTAFFGKWTIFKGDRKSGFRYEGVGLRWPAVNLERGEMQIVSSLKDVRGHRSLGNPKTPHSRRTIPLTPLAIPSLRRHRIEQAQELLASEMQDWNSDQLVFCTSVGTPYSQTNFRKQRYIPLLQKAKLPYVRPHDLRHTAATLLLLEGVQPLVVSEMLGHASVAVTLATYCHVQAEMRKPARDAMERLFGSAFA